MYQNLRKKLEETSPLYYEEEILWLLDHIGHPEATIRDELVFSSLARGLQANLPQHTFANLRFAGEVKHNLGNLTNTFVGDHAFGL